MAAHVYNNAKGGMVSILVVGVNNAGAGATHNVHYELSDLASPDPSVEAVEEVRIAKVVTSGAVTVLRGASGADATDGTVVIKTESRYNLDLREGMVLSVGAAQNLTVQAGVSTTVVLQCSKTSRFVSSTLGPDELTPTRH